MTGMGGGGYQAFDRHRDAGRIWQTCLGGFLRAYGLRQLVSDRRVWVQDSPLGVIIYLTMWTIPVSPRRPRASSSTSTGPWRCASGNR
jgi:hypothetical protein